MDETTLEGFISRNEQRKRFAHQMQGLEHGNLRNPMTYLQIANQDVDELLATIADLEAALLELGGGEYEPNVSYETTDPFTIVVDLQTFDHAYAATATTNNVGL